MPQAGAPTDPKELLPALLADIRHRLPFDAFTVSLLEGGIESIVARLASADGRVLVAKFAPQRFTGNANDPDLDFLDLYRQEQEITRECAAHGIPVCRVADVFLSDLGVATLIMDHVDHDGSAPDSASLGALARSLHGMPVRRTTTVAMRESAAADILARLTLERLQVVAGHAGGLAWLPQGDALVSLLRPLERSASLLHMDLRAANVLCAAGAPRALIDWANAVVANPLLEIARLREYDLLDEAFRRAYRNDALVEALGSATGLACRLYTAAMMAVLFLSEIPDEQRGRERVARLQALLGELRQAMDGGSPP